MTMVQAWAVRVKCGCDSEEMRDAWGGEGDMKERLLRKLFSRSRESSRLAALLGERRVNRCGERDECVLWR